MSDARHYLTRHGLTVHPHWALGPARSGRWFVWIYYRDGKSFQYSALNQELSKADLVAMVRRAGVEPEARAVAS